MERNETGRAGAQPIYSYWKRMDADYGGRCVALQYHDGELGSMGVIWGRPSVTAYIRQSRYTKDFVDQGEYFTISFFDEAYRSALNLCGTVSGRDRDKIKEAGLTPVDVEGTAAFEEAKLVLLCKKQFHQFMSPDGFDVKENDTRWYADRDYHTMYIGSIEKIYKQEA